MSVPVNQRTESKLEVFVRAHDLAVYTIKITSNAKNFPEEYRHALTDEITRTAIQIFTKVWAANNVMVRTEDDYRMRRERRKLRRLIGRSKRGLIPREKVDESFKAWKNHAAKGDSFKLIRRMEQYYKSLWEG